MFYPTQTALDSDTAVFVLKKDVKLQPTQTAHRPPKGRKNAIYCSCWPWSLTLTFKLVQVRDQTRLPCEFGANPFSGSQYISYTNKKTTDWWRQKQNLLQFTACGKNSNKNVFKALDWKDRLRKKHNRINSLFDIWRATHKQAINYSPIINSDRSPGRRIWETEPSNHRQRLFWLQPRWHNTRQINITHLKYLYYTQTC